MGKPLEVTRLVHTVSACVRSLPGPVTVGLCDVFWRWRLCWMVRFVARRYRPVAWTADTP